MLFVLPVFALYSMAIGQPASLAIDPVHGVPLLISFFLWDKVSQDGTFNWAEGGLLCIVALLTWGSMFFVG
jgi:Ca2+/H+ antiporter